MLLVCESRSSIASICTYLISEKVEGKSATRAPPNSSVDLKVDMVMLISRRRL